MAILAYQLKAVSEAVRLASSLPILVEIA